jgi:hypothetical protein
MIRLKENVQLAFVMIIEERKRTMQIGSNLSLGSVSIGEELLFIV